MSRCQERPTVPSGPGYPVILYRSSAEGVNATFARPEGDFHSASHPVYCTLTLLTRGRATLKRRSPISHPGGSHPTIGLGQATRRQVRSWVGDHQRMPARRGSLIFFESWGKRPLLPYPSGCSRRTPSILHLNTLHVPEPGSIDPCTSSSRTIIGGSVKATGSQQFIPAAERTLLISVITAHPFLDPPVKMFAEAYHHREIALREMVLSSC